MSGQQTTILLFVALLALVFYLYNSGRLSQVTNAITGNTSSAQVATNPASVVGIPTIGTVHIIGTGSSTLPNILPSTPNTRRFVMPNGNWHYDPATNTVLTDQSY